MHGTFLEARTCSLNNKKYAGSVYLVCPKNADSVRWRYYTFNQPIRRATRIGRSTPPAAGRGKTICYNRSTRSICPALALWQLPLAGQALRRCCPSSCGCSTAPSRARSFWTLRQSMSRVLLRRWMLGQTPSPRSWLVTKSRAPHWPTTLPRLRRGAALFGLALPSTQPSAVFAGIWSHWPFAGPRAGPTAEGAGWQGIRLAAIAGLPCWRKCRGGTIGG